MTAFSPVPDCSPELAPDVSSFPLGDLPTVPGGEPGQSIGHAAVQAPTFQSDNAARAVGSFTFVLHSHLPYVLSHGKWPHGTDWLCEAVAEAYIPLLRVFHQLLSEGVTPRVTLGLTPILCEQLVNEGFKQEFESYCGTKIMAAQANAQEFAMQDMTGYGELADFWAHWYANVLHDFQNTYARDIVGGFKKLQDDGHIEIITCAATHGYLPLLGTDESVQAQVKIGVETYKKHFGTQPRGIWLPECAYRPRYEWSAHGDVAAPGDVPFMRKGVEEFLSENNIEYFVVDAHLLNGGEGIGGYAERFGNLKEPWESAPKTEPAPSERTPFEAYHAESSIEGEPVAFFTRHERTALQVWSGEHGYPGDGVYLDFHKKHFPGGHRLWRVTDAKSDLSQKQPYEPARVDAILDAQAQHFVELVREDLTAHGADSGTPGVICAPYDAELFGHWWFEGPRWLYRVLKSLWEADDIDLSTGERFLKAQPPKTAVSLPEGSWGEGGYHYSWLNEDTAWTWREIYECERVMCDLAQEHAATASGELRDILQQCARELLLMESSDWQFLISTVAARDYAELRCSGHVNVFQRLTALAYKVGRGGTLTDGEREFLRGAQQRDTPFADVDVSLWARVQHPALKEKS